MTSKVDIEYVAKLANLPLSAEEKEHFTPQLESIVTFVEKLDELDTTNVEPTYNVSNITNAVREDVITSSLTQQESLSNAANSENGYITVKGVISYE